MVTHSYSHPSKLEVRGGRARINFDVKEKSVADGEGNSHTIYEYTTLQINHVISEDDCDKYIREYYRNSALEKLKELDLKVLREVEKELLKDTLLYQQREELRDIIKQIDSNLGVESADPIKE